MNDLTRTGLYLAGAVLLTGAAVFIRPSTPTDAFYNDEGEAFYASFIDPLAAASLEVIDYDPETGTARPFKVELTEGKWRIPSHYDYPADGEERLANTASAMIDLRKDIVQSDRREDHETLGVIDPLDESTPTLVGRGQRVTLRDASGSELASFIIGNPVEGKEGFRSVRLPEKKRTYAVKVDVDVSTRFADWIETNLLDVQGPDIANILVNDYTIDETTGRVVVADNIMLSKTGPGFDAWELDGLAEDREIDVAKLNSMTRALADITITGVRPKPEGLTTDLRSAQGLRMDGVTQMSLQSRGFFVSQDGRLLSNEGEVRVATGEGVVYVLRFGEILFGSGLDVSAGTEIDDDDPAEETAEDGGAENRYLFVTAQFDESLLDPRPTEPTMPRPGTDTTTDETAAAETPNESEPEMAPESTENEEEAAGPTTPDPAEAQRVWAVYDATMIEWERQAEAGRSEVQRLNERFAPWYYVISSKDFKDIRLNRESMTKPKAP